MAEGTGLLDWALQRPEPSGEWHVDQVTRDPVGWEVRHMHHTTNGMQVVALVGPDCRIRHWEIVR